MSDETPPAGRSLRATAARGSAITLVAQGLRVIVLFASTILLARLISPTDFGLLAMVLAITAIAEIFRDFGLSMAALRAKTITQHQKSNLFWLNALVGIVIGALVWGLSWPIAAFYQHDALVPVVQALASVYVLGGFTAQFRVAINRSLRFFALAVCDVLPPLIAFATAFALALMGYGLVALVAQQIVTAALTLVFAVVLAQWWPSLPRRGQQMGQLLSFGFNFAATQLLSYATRNVDSIAIGRVWGATSLGFYDRAFQLAVAPLNQINAPMSRVAIPVLTRVSDQRDKYVASLRQAQLIACYVTASGLLFVAGAGTPLTLVLLGPEWREAGPILSVLAIGAVFRAIQQVSYWIFMSEGRADSQLRLFLVGQPVIIACMLAGLPWGPIGVAAGNVVGYAFFWAFSLWWAGRIADIDVRPLMGDAVRAILLFGAPAGVASLLVSLFVPAAPALQVLFALLASVAWFGLMGLVSRRVRGDLGTLVRFASLAIGRGGT